MLAAIRSLCDLDISDSNLIALSGRGGASGIGVNAFFSGGFIVDDGQSQSEVADLLPSSSRSPEHMPLPSVRMDFPDEWEIHLLWPPGAETSGDTERRIFRENTPIRQASVHETLANVYHGLVPAFNRKDLALLRESLLAIGKEGFKAIEIGIQAPLVGEILADLLFDGQVAAGMSSMGPLIYAIILRNDHSARQAIALTAARHGVRQSGPYMGANEGFENI
jgi:beta-ribofuranosylaminobenzene 5'-phosphate synthase